MKPLGYKSYGSIPHLIGSRVGPSDHHAEAGQCRIATEKYRDRHDVIIVQEKLDGSNVGVAKINGHILALTRSGYLANTSIYKTHHAFDEYVKRNESRFIHLLKDGERVCGEWMLTAVGTKYILPHEPFVPFDLITGKERVNYIDTNARLLAHDFTTPKLLSIGEPMSIDSAMNSITISGHGAVDDTEGAIWRIERKGKVDFLCKYVKPSKVDGKYLDTDIINSIPSEFDYLKDFFIDSMAIRD